MIKAELNYNPYVNELGVKFNGQEPRINSQIEKYQGLLLQEWVYDIPTIFYDEMNGYDFELDFTGTTLDYELLKNAFKTASVTDDMVSFFLINELESRERKIERIEELILWIKNNPNSRFDSSSFLEANDDLFNAAYPYIVLNGSVENRKIEKDINVERIDSVKELHNTNIMYTPILICLDSVTIQKLQINLNYLERIKHVIKKQLFFYVGSDLDKAYVERLLKDLGMDANQIVSEVFDNKVKQFFKLYPITDYIQNSVKAFRTATTEISKELEVINRESEISGQEVYKKLADIEKDIESLKSTDDKFSRRNNLNVPIEFINASEEVKAFVANWRNNRVKISSDAEAIVAANDMVKEVSRCYREFQTNIMELLTQGENQISETYNSWYKNTGVEEGFRPDETKLTDVLIPDFPVKPDELMQLKTEQSVDVKENLIDVLIRVNTVEQKKPVMEKVYFYQSWRKYMFSAMSQVVEKVVESVFDQLQMYSNRLAEEYHLQITKLINDKNVEKETTSTQLSEDEKHLQEDNDWLKIFLDHIEKIERE